MERTSENRADTQAAQWAVRLAHGDIAAEGRLELDAWLEQDRRNRGALLRAQAALDLMENAAADAAPAPVRPGNDTVYKVREARKPRPWTMAACIAGLLAVGAAVFALHGGLLPTGTQQMRLADGSVVTLPKGAQITYAFDGNRRNVTLVSGQATFKVAHDRAHPFVVRSGDVFAQATGTVYSVGRIGETGAAVGVTEGSVLVWARDENDQAILVHAGDKLTLNPGAGAAASARESAEISLENETVESAVKRFNRVNREQIVVTDPVIGQTRIIGLFKANEPARFAQAVAAMSRGRVVQGDGNIVIEPLPAGVQKK